MNKKGGWAWGVIAAAILMLFVLGIILLASGGRLTNLFKHLAGLEERVLDLEAALPAGVTLDENQIKKNAVRLTNEGKCEEAEKELGKINLDTKPKLTRLQFVRNWRDIAECYEKKDNFAKAREIYNFVKTIEGQEAAGKELVAFEIAEAYEEEKQWKNALDEYSKILRDFKQPFNGDKAQYKIGLMNYNLGKYNEAVASLGEFLVKYPKSDFVSDSYLIIGKSYSKLKKPLMAYEFLYKSKFTDILNKEKDEDIEKELEEISKDNPCYVYLEEGSRQIVGTDYKISNAYSYYNALRWFIDVSSAFPESVCIDYAKQKIQWLCSNPEVLQEIKAKEECDKITIPKT